MRTAAAFVVAGCLALGLSGCEKRGEAVAGDRVGVANTPGFTPRSCGSPFPYLMEIERRPTEFPPIKFTVLCPAAKGQRMVVTQIYKAKPSELFLANAAWLLKPMVWLHLLLTVWLLWARDPFGLRDSLDELSDIKATIERRTTGGGLQGDGLPVLAPVRCHNCAATVPLRDAELVACQSCNASVEIPTDHREPARLRARTHRALTKMAPLWRSYLRLTHPAVRFLWDAVRLAFPPLFVSVFVYGWWLGVIHHFYIVYGLVYLVASIGVSVQLAATIGVRPPFSTRPSVFEPTAIEIPRAELEAGSACRQCGAPLWADSAAELVLGCGYCGTEHLLVSRARRGHAVAAKKAELVANHLLSSTLQLEVAFRRFWITTTSLSLIAAGLSAVAGLVGILS